MERASERCVGRDVEMEIEIGVDETAGESTHSLRTPARSQRMVNLAKNERVD